MASVRLYGDTSGFIELKAPDVADDNVVDLGLVPTIDTAPSDGQVLTWNASLSKWEAKDMKMREKRIEAFTGSGTWTVPAGVTYAIAHMLGGGGGVGRSTTGADGGNSSVAFASGTITATGGARHNISDRYVTHFARPGSANSGAGAAMNTEHGNIANDSAYGSCEGASGALITAGAAVTPGASISVTVGDGGTAGTSGAAGGSGYVYIEYYEEV